VSFGWCYLAASILLYGLGNFLQSVAATRTSMSIPAFDTQ